jgi:hypothetical protein
MNRIGRFGAIFSIRDQKTRFIMKRPTPLSRQCGTGKRRRKRRKKSGAENYAPDQHIEERIPDWIVRQAAREKAWASGKAAA